MTHEVISSCAEYEHSHKEPLRSGVYPYSGYKLDRDCLPLPSRN